MSQARIEGTVVALDTRINGSIDMFYDHIKQGKGWRSIIAGIVIALIMQFVGFAFVFGRMDKTLEVNERVLQRILPKYEAIAVSKDEEVI